jgi:hypothetical protein
LLAQIGLKALFMRHSEISAHFRDQADRLLAGDLNRISQEYAFPLPIHFPNDLAVAFNLEDSSAILARRRAELVARGVVALRPSITAVDLPRAGRFRVWVDWKEQTAAEAEMRGSSAIYYCRAAATGLQTEMIQYTYVSSPGQGPQQDDLALSA